MAHEKKETESDVRDLVLEDARLINMLSSDADFVARLHAAAASGSWDGVASKNIERFAIAHFSGILGPVIDNGADCSAEIVQAVRNLDTILAPLALKIIRERKNNDTPRVSPLLESLNVPSAIDFEQTWIVNGEHFIPACYLTLERSGKVLYRGTLTWGDVSFLIFALSQVLNKDIEFANKLPVSFPLHPQAMPLDEIGQKCRDAAALLGNCLERLEGLVTRRQQRDEGQES